jgi:hypothetical protein
MCVETTQGLSLYSYIYLKLAKNTTFFLLCFSFNKTEEQAGGMGLGVGGGPNNVHM